MHEAHKEGAMFHTGDKDVNSVTGCCVLLVMNIDVPGFQEPAAVMWDSAATISLITFRKAKEMKLKGNPTRLMVAKTGGFIEELESMKYIIYLKDEHDGSFSFIVYGIPEISTKLQSIEAEDIVKCFPRISDDEIKRPKGKIDVLIGMDYTAFHPRFISSCKQLVLLGNRFGKCIGGRYEGNQNKPVSKLAYLNHVSAEATPEFFAIEALGVECFPKCGSCKCGKCPAGGHAYSLKEERELALTEKGLSFNGTEWEAEYPWIKSSDELPDNKAIAVAILHSTEKRLSKNKLLAESYKGQMDDMVRRGVCRILTSNEISKYHGPVHYIAHHEVMNPNSKTTPCRIVFNSSAKFHGHSLNDYWTKGPDMINNLLGVSLRFRENLVAMAVDISKMYHSVRISERGQHTHRFLWQNLDSWKPPDTYVMTVVSFGDRPAGTIASIAVLKTAEMECKKYPKAYDCIANNMYVDDILDSVATVEEAHLLANSVEKVLTKGNFQIKEWCSQEKII